MMPPLTPPTDGDTMATRRDDRAAQISASFSTDPFFSDRPAPRGGYHEEVLDDDDLLEDGGFDEEATRVHVSEAAWEEGELDDDGGAGFGDEERTMIWQGGAEEHEEAWPAPAPAPIVYAQRQPTQRQAAVPRQTQRQAPVHHGAPGVADVAPRRDPAPTGGGVYVADAVPAGSRAPVAPAPRTEWQPTPPPPTATGAVQAAPEQRGMPTVQVVLVVLLALLLTAVLALAASMMRRSDPAPIPAVQPAATATIAVFSTPPGATVTVDGEARDSRTPAILTGLEIGRVYTVAVALDGYETVNATITPATAEPVQREFVLTPATGTLLVTTAPLGATISLDGVDRGPSPQSIPGLDMSRAYTVTATLDGHTPATQQVRWEAGASREQTVALALVPVPAEPPPAAEPEPVRAAPAEAPARVERPTRPPSTATTPSRTTTTPTRPSSTTSAPAEAPSRPSARPSERPSSSTSTATRPSSSTSSSSSSSASGGGTISVQAVPYGQVWINNRMVANETPLLNHALPAGVHSVKVYFTSLRTFSDERSVRIEPGASRTLTFRAPPQ